MNKHEFLALLDRYSRGEATEEETQNLLNYYNSFQASDQWNEAELGAEKQVDREIFKKLRASIQASTTSPVVSVNMNRWRYVAAASILVLATAGALLLMNRREKPPVYSQQDNRNLHTLLEASEVLLTFSDGQRISLDNLADGIVFKTGNTTFIKSGSVMLCKHSDGPESDAAVANNIITVPRGRQYQVVLPDGSKVRLNTYSSLSFPSSFASNSRGVGLTGEGYFEIEKDLSKPFRVNAFVGGAMNDRTVVEVLGTQFNVNAYEDEAATKTTLIEGSVKISSEGEKQTRQSRVLMPGQQALVSAGASEASIKVSSAQAGAATAWTSGLFDFRNADIQTIMRELARWYNVDVVYQSQIPGKKFSGKFKRDLRLVTVLQILAESSIHFRIEGKKVFVSA